MILFYFYCFNFNFMILLLLLSFLLFMILLPQQASQPLITPTPALDISLSSGKQRR